MAQPGTLFIFSRKHQRWHKCCSCNVRLKLHPLASTAWRVFLLLLLLLLFLPSSVVLIPRLLGPHGGATAEAAQNGPRPTMTESLRQFRAHQVATGAAVREGVTKFVVQEYVGVLPTGQETGSGSESSSSTSSWRTLSFKDVTELWRSSPTFAEMFAASIAAVPSEALFWESAPVTRTTMNKPYEYVTVDSPHLASVSEDGRAFAEHLASQEGTNSVVTFRNMRKDARLVVPCRGGQAGTNYAHLAAFVRSAPRDQVIDFFGAVGVGLEEEVASRVDESPVWLSTSGLGVYWLHARLDSVPKYYAYTPYKQGY